MDTLRGESVGLILSETMVSSKVFVLFTDPVHMVAICHEMYNFEQSYKIFDKNYSKIVLMGNR